MKSKLCPPEYRIRKKDRLWTLTHIHCQPSINRYGEHITAQSSDWSLLMWMATGDNRYRRLGYGLASRWCS